MPTSHITSIPMSGMIQDLYTPKLFYPLLVIILAYCVSFCIRSNITNGNGCAIPSGPLLRYASLGKYPERALHAWAQKYGPLFSLFVGNQLFMVISDPQVAHNLLVTNGKIFSSRKEYFIKTKTILRGRGITSTPYGDTWRKHRRLATLCLNPKAVEARMLALDYEASNLVQSLFLDTRGGSLPVNASQYATRFVLNNMLRIMFDTRIDSAQDPIVTKAMEIGLEFMELTGVFSNSVDFIKPLQWLPTTTRTRARKAHDALVDAYSPMILRVKERLDSNQNVEDCLAKTLLLEQEKEGLDWEDICMLTVVFTVGGVHSTAGLIMWTVALIASHPDVQQRAHEELDKVIGRQTWPSAEDEKQLPYIRAIIKEVQRLRPPFLVPAPHTSTEDFVYNGYYIPKGTCMVMNMHTLNRNEERYRNADVFDPDRYLGDVLSCKESAAQADFMMRDHWTFGAGRRMCPGIYIAERELWLAVSRLLWCFEIRALPGEPICLDDWEGKNGRTPIPFRVNFEPRHENVASLLSDSKDAMYQGPY